MASPKIAVIACLVLVAAIAVVYGNALNGSFLYDDNQLIVNNPLVKDLGRLPVYFQTDLFSYRAGVRVSNSYRPLHTLSNAVDYLLYGDDPWGFHLTNIILHTGVVLAVFFLVRRLSGKIAIAFAAALLYGVHPVNTQSVSYISGRADILMTLFLVTGIVFFLHVGPRRVLFLSLSAICYCLAVLSREAAWVVFPLLIICYLAVFRRAAARPAREAVVYAVAAIVLAVVRGSVLPGPGVPIGTEGIPLAARIATALKSLWVGLRIMLYPADLHFDRAVAVERSIATAPALLSVAGIAIVFWAALRLYRAARREASVNGTLAVFGLLWFGVSMTPYLQLVPLQIFVSENWLYQPAIGMIVASVAAAGWLAERRPLRKRPMAWIAAAAVAAAACGYGWTTHLRNDDYAGPVRLYEKNLSFEPNVKFYYMLGTEFGLRKEYPKAIDMFMRAIEMDRRTPNLFVFNARYNLGVTYAELGERAKALEQLYYLRDLRGVPPATREEWRQAADAAIRQLGG